MISDPRITQSEEWQVAALPLRIRREESMEVMGPAFQEVFAVLEAQGIPPAGPLTNHHLKMEPGIFDFRICVPVDNPVTPSGRVIPGTLRAAKVAQVDYIGPYEGLPGAWEEFMTWIEGQGLKVADDLWESYVEGPHSNPDPNTYRTVLNKPLVD
jgi:effector-binding domain-containing protein